jgi:SWI/SNF chromatin-remodeling complex subunit SWI1
MNQWPSHDPLPNGNGNGFADPSAMIQVDNPNIFAPAFANQQHQQQQPHHPQQQPATPNAQNRSHTPQQFPYNVPSVVPSKRPRPADEGAIASPGQPPVSMNMSRSQTPQQAGAFPSPFPYQQHLQHAGSANATPSPTMSNQQFRPGAPPGQPQAHHQQRMQTASPHPPHPQQQGMSISPPPGDVNGRMTPQTPQFPGGQMGMAMPGQPGAPMHGQMNPQMAAAAGFVPGANMGQGFPPGFQGMAAQGQHAQFGSAQPNLPPNLAAQQAEVQRQYQLKLQQQQYHSAMQQRQRMAGMTPMANQQATSTPTRPQPGQAPNPAQQMMQAQQAQQAQAFVKTVQTFMQRNNRPFETSPIISGRPINIYALFSIVARAGGSERLNATNSWGKVATALQFNEAQYPAAGMEIKDVYDRNLAPYEAAYAQHQQQARKKPDGIPQGGQMSPTKAPQTPQTAHHQQHTPQMQTRPGPTPHMTPQMTPVQGNAALPMQNGFATPQADTPSLKGQLAQRKSIGQLQEASPAPSQPGMASAERVQQIDPTKLPNGTEPIRLDPAPLPEPDCYQPSKIHFYQHYGGLEIDAFFGPNHLTEEILKLRPTVPDPVEMGLIDIRAISNSLQSGIKREVRYALDVLQKITFFFPLDLAHCEDLLEIIVDCGEEQLEQLAEHIPEVLDHIELASYEDVVRHTRVELEWSLQDQHEVGSTEYNLDRTAERLLAVTRILRNLSLIQVNSNDRNSQLLAHSIVMKFLSNAIRHLGTRTMFLRSHWKVHEFMTDVVHILSNVSDEITLPSDEETLSILHFLLTFGPTPDPSSSPELFFPSYDPKRHKYYYHAIDSLAKLLIKDSNRTSFRNVFAETWSPKTESSASNQELRIHQRYNIVTRAFGLAIAVIPDHSGLMLPDERLVLVREAILSQGVLAADVITGLLPSNAAPDLARAWLGSRDCWVACMINLCRSIFNDMGMRNHEGWCAFMNRGFGMLSHLGTLGLGKYKPKKSVEESGLLTFEAPGSPALNGDAGEDGVAIEAVAPPQEKQKGSTKNSNVLIHDDGITAEMLPNWTFVLGALNMAKMDTDVLRSLVALASLDE